MNKTAFEIIDNGLEKSLKEVLKTAAKAENAALRSGAGVMKKSIRDEIKSKKLKATGRNPKYIDRLIDAVKSSKPKNGEIKIHILGTRKPKSGTYRLRFFESPKIRYNLTYKGVKLKKKRKVGSLSKFNGFFASGISTSKSDVERKMDETLTKYIKKAWNG